MLSQKEACGLRLPVRLFEVQVDLKPSTELAWQLERSVPIRSPDAPVPSPRASGPMVPSAGPSAPDTGWKPPGPEAQEDCQCGSGASVSGAVTAQPASGSESRGWRWARGLLGAFFGGRPPRRRISGGGLAAW